MITSYWAKLETYSYVYLPLLISKGQLHRIVYSLGKVSVMLIPSNANKAGYVDKGVIDFLHLTELYFPSKFQNAQII